MILLLSITEDSHTEAIIHAIEQLGGEYVRLNTDQFSNISVSFNTQGGEIILPDSTSLNTSYINSIWGRRRFLPSELKNVPAEYQSFAESQWTCFSDNLWIFLRDKNWLNNPCFVEQARQKIFQLQIAEKMGFKIPSTIFSNTLSQVRKLLKESKYSKVIYKPVGHGVVKKNEKSEETVIFTTALNEKDIEEDREKEIRIAPGIFQECVPKAYEVRVTVVENLVFAVRIDSQESSRTKIDWRRYDFANVTHSVEKLPDHISDKCVRLIQALGLRYGAMDLIVTPDGDWVFLENNCNGQWLWLEKLTGLKISEAIAAALIRVDVKENK